MPFGNSKQKMVMKNRRVQDLTRFTLILGILILLNVLSSFQFFRIDLTAENRYTLSEATLNFIEPLEEVVLVKVYLEGDFPAGFQRLQSETRQMLDELRAYNSNIEYIFINPSNNATKKETQKLYQQLQSRGLKPYQLQVNEKGGNSVKTVFPGAIISKGEKEVAVNLLINQLGTSPQRQINSSIQNLEYTLANAIRSLSTEKKPLIGFLQGHGELGPKDLADMGKQLSQNYSVDLFNIREFKADSITGKISLAQQQSTLNRFDALVIAKPQKAFTDLDKYLIDQFVMTGGKTVWLIDPVQASMDSLSEKSRFLSLPLFDRLNLNDLLFKYGVRLNTNLVTDMVSAGVNDQRKTKPWVYFPLAMPTVKHPITKDLNAIWFRFTSTLDTIITPNTRKTILLKSSKYSNTYATPHMVNLATLYNPPPQERFTKQGLPLGVLIEGTFESLYKNRILPQNQGKLLKPRFSSKQNQMVVVADGDLIRNQFNIVNPNIPKRVPLPVGYDQFTGQQYGNANFMLNTMDYLLDDSGLIEVRTRELKIRLLDGNLINAQRLTWQLINTLIPLALVIGFGIIYNYFRKRKYA
jgi:ABC-2 type transport system permease protein